MIIDRHPLPELEDAVRVHAAGIGDGCEGGDSEAGGRDESDGVVGGNEIKKGY
jgi:hypothetical protein